MFLILFGVLCMRCVAVGLVFFFFLMIRRPPRSTLDRSSAASDVYKRQEVNSTRSFEAPEGNGSEALMM